MINDLNDAAKAAGFCQGFLKAAGPSLQALIDAARIVVNPKSESQLAQLGKNIYGMSRDSSRPTNAFMNFLLPKYQSVEQAAAIQEKYKNILRAAQRTSRGQVRDPAFVREQLNKRHNELRQVFGEIGAGVEPRLRFARNAIPAAGAASIAGPAAYATGQIMGHQDQETQDQSEMVNAPLLRRLQYTVFPQTQIAKPKSFFERLMSSGAPPTNLNSNTNANETGRI